MYCRRHKNLVTKSVRGGFGRIRACLLACSSLAVLVFALVPAPVLAATTNAGCAHANFDNQGHHYGLIKNGCLQTQSPPPPVLTPHPAPAPTTNPVSSGIPATVHAVAPVTPGVNEPTELVPGDATPTPLTVNIPPLASQPANAIVPSNDRNPWVVVGLLASALLLLLLVALVVSSYLRRQQQRANAPAH